MAHIFQRPLLRSLLINEGVYICRTFIQREICITESIGLAYSWKAIWQIKKRVVSICLAPDKVCKILQNKQNIPYFLDFELIQTEKNVLKWKVRLKYCMFITNICKLGIRYVMTFLQ